MTKTMTRDEARRLVHDDFYAEYVRLGGKLSQEDYEEAVTQFLAVTFHAYIGGEGSRHKAWTSFVRWLREHRPGEYPNRIFASVGNVQPYT